jgi:hypothetical protein
MTVAKVVAVILIFVAASVGWAVLGGLTQLRTNQASRDLGGALATLWGTERTQTAPAVFHMSKTQQQVRDPLTKKMLTQEVVSWSPVPLSASQVRADFHLDYRKKGLLWFSTCELRFNGHYVTANPFDKPITMRVDFP